MLPIWPIAMRVAARLRALWTNLAGRADVDRELDAELSSYIELLAARYEEAGLVATDARRRALLDVGGVESTKEATRDAWTGNALIVALRETRQTLRSLSRAPLYAATIIITLTVAIGSATALFTVVKGSLLRPLPAVADPDRLVSLEPMRNGVALYDFSYPDYLDLRRAPSLSGLAMFDGTSMSLRDSIGAERHMVSYVNGEFFAVLGVKPVLGRALDTTDVGANVVSPVVVISYDLWQRHFNGSPDAIGAKLTLDGTSITVVGVAPRGFLGAMAMHAMDLWLPVSMLGPMSHSPTHFEQRDARLGRLVGRLAPGKTIADARAELTTIAERLAKTYVEDRDRTIAVYPGAAMTMEERADASRMPALLAIAITLLLLITCANVANLSLMRTTARRRELATRLALGASRGSLVARLSMESAILAGAAAIGGIGLAFILVHSSALVSLVVDMDAMDLSLDWRVVAVTIGVAVVAMLLVALASAVETLRVPVESLLRDGGRAVRRRSLKQRVLVVVQVAASFVLLLTSAAVFSSVRHTMRNEVGLEPAGVGTTFLSPRNAGLDSMRQRMFYQSLLTNVRGEPTVGAAALASTVPPATWAVASRVFRRGEEPPPGTPLDKGPHAPTHAYVDMISPGFFDVLRIPLVTGRDFASTDDIGSEPVAIVSKRLAGVLWPHEAAVGKYVVRPRVTGPVRPPLRVVGVVADVRYAGVGSEPAPTLYIAYRQSTDLGSLTLIARGRGGAAVPDTLVREAARRLAPDADPGLATPLTTQMNAEFAPQRRVTGWLGAFGAIAVILAALGLYGVIAQDVFNRTRELAVRSALGASPRRLVSLILEDGIHLTMAGVVIGAIASVATTRLIRVLFTAIEHFDPFTGVLTMGFLVSISLIASYVPAARVARFDIVKALRAD
jgi:putative ABC transport system permease protein